MHGKSLHVQNIKPFCLPTESPFAIHKIKILPPKVWPQTDQIASGIIIPFSIKILKP